LRFARWSRAAARSRVFFHEEKMMLVCIYISCNLASAVFRVENLPFVSRFGLDIVEEGEKFRRILECGSLGSESDGCVDVVRKIWRDLAFHTELASFLLVETLWPAAMAHEMFARRDENTTVSVSCLIDAKNGQRALSAHVLVTLL
jgi:hypothetical protein